MPSLCGVIGLGSYKVKVFKNNKKISDNTIVDKYGLCDGDLKLDDGDELAIVTSSVNGTSKWMFEIVKNEAGDTVINKGFGGDRSVILPNVFIMLFQESQEGTIKILSNYETIEL